MGQKESKVEPHTFSNVFLPRAPPCMLAHHANPREQEGAPPYTPCNALNTLRTLPLSSLPLSPAHVPSHVGFQRMGDCPERGSTRTHALPPFPSPFCPLSLVCSSSLYNFKCSHVLVYWLFFRSIFHSTMGSIWWSPLWRSW